jgi:hypothetical protein
MLYSPWGAYVPMGADPGYSQYTGATPGTSPGGGGFASLYSPEAISAYGSTLSSIFGAVANRNVPPPVTYSTTGSYTPLIVAGVAVVGLILLLRAVRK